MEKRLTGVNSVLEQKLVVLDLRRISHSDIAQRIARRVGREPRRAISAAQAIAISTCHRQP